MDETCPVRITEIDTPVGPVVEVSYDSHLRDLYGDEWLNEQPRLYIDADGTKRIETGNPLGGFSDLVNAHPSSFGAGNAKKPSPPDEGDEG
jgi:hypothetical protein